MNQVRVALKVDVDTLVGLREGVPRLCRALGSRGIRATFFLSLGPDNSGRAIFRVFRRKGFLNKMIRNRAPAAYGFKTLFYGTLLPAPMIGERTKGLLAALGETEHEIGVHGYDHVFWHDHLGRLSEAQVQEQMSAGIDAVTRLTGRQVRAFASPGWQVSRASLSVEDLIGFKYASDTRGRSPFRPDLDGVHYLTPQIPTTMPTMDEIMGLPGVGRDQLAAAMLSQIKKTQLNVMTIHAEIEGRGYLNDFLSIIRVLQDRGAGFVTLEEVAANLPPGDDLPSSPVVMGFLPGRAGQVALQG
ncbi:MAG: 4-deoxy-4-formamido-L-arabinose-phosphoundecaprenol deformylase [Deltaproteobacteria bacterium]|nr:4-deoxy-4-formamido-L-arabinose-phosphoundecaprenol deformylase [Deltaproteobacteria bacterium]